MNRKRVALLKDLGKLYAEIPAIVDGVIAGDEKVIADAVALIRGASGARLQVAMNRLTDFVLNEAQKGNSEPLRMAASGEAFDL